MEDDLNALHEMSELPKSATGGAQISIEGSGMHEPSLRQDLCRRGVLPALRTLVEGGISVRNRLRSLHAVPLDLVQWSLDYLHLRLRSPNASKRLGNTNCIGLKRLRFFFRFKEEIESNVGSRSEC